MGCVWRPVVPLAADARGGLVHPSALFVGSSQPPQTPGVSHPKADDMSNANAPLNAVLAALCISLLVQPVGAAPPESPPPAQGTVSLTGWLHVEDLSFRKTTVEVEYGGLVYDVPVTKTGRFDLNLPDDLEAVVRFAHPGHLTKEVLVDTHHAKQGEPGKRDRRIRFAVILQDEREMTGFDYAGPVGNIGFDAEGGCTVVERTLILKQGPRTRLRVFEG